MFQQAFYPPGKPEFIGSQTQIPNHNNCIVFGYTYICYGSSKYISKRLICFPHTQKR